LGKKPAIIDKIVPRNVGGHAMIAAGYETSVLYYRFDASELLADRLSAFGDAPLVHALAKRDVMSKLWNVSV